MIKLSKYTDDLIEKYNSKYQDNCNIVINNLNKLIKDDLYKIGNSKDPVILYNNLKGYLLRFHKQELINSFKLVNYDYKHFKNFLITCFIITFFRDENIAHILYDTLKQNNIVTRFILVDDIKYELITPTDTLTFYKIEEYFEDNLDILNKINNMDSIYDNCHEICEYLLTTNKNYYSLTGIITNDLEEKIFHSVILDNDIIIDIPSGIIMKQSDYLKIHDFQIINKVNYQELINQDNICKQYDESKTLYPLLRCMIYRLYKKNDK